MRANRRDNGLVRHRFSEGGFILVELLVAVVLIATGLTAAASAFSAATRAQGVAVVRSTAARLAEVKLAEIQAAGAASGNADGDFSELDTAAQASVLADYRYHWEVTTGEIEGLARVEVEVWHREQEAQRFTLVCYLPSQETTQ
jgi:type II secretory pathway pseudopilin PulG